MPLTPLELAELDQVVRNGQMISGQVAAMGKLTAAGCIDALCRTVRLLQARLTPPAARPAELEQPAPAPDEATAAGET